MAEIVDESDLPLEKPRPFRLDWILPVLFRPRKAMGEVARTDPPAWLVPMLLISLLAVIAVLLAGPLRIQQLLSQPPQLPPEFQYMSPDQQQKYLEAAQPNTGGMFIYGFPALGALMGIWLTWFVLGGLLHLGLTMQGGRSSRGADFNVAAWAMLPIAVRYLVQSVYMLASRTLITQPGLSGFAPPEATGGMAYLAALLALIDLYWIWQTVLLAIGASHGSGLARGKAVGAALTVSVLVLLLSALPGFGASALSGLTVTRPFFLF